MKAKTDDYDDCLIAWETIWAAHALYSEVDDGVGTSASDELAVVAGGGDVNRDTATSGDVCANGDDQASAVKSSSTTCEKLANVELFTLCVCLSIIRRERDLIMANGYDACEILKVRSFYTLRAASC